MTKKVGTSVNCPECKKPVSLRGFSGHMRFKHGIAEANSKEVFRDVKSDTANPNNAARLFQLMDTLIECRERKERVEGMDEGPIFPLLWRDEGAEALRKGLEMQEKLVLEELKSLGYVGTREDS